MTKPTIKSEKLNKKAIIIVGIFACIFSAPYLLIGLLPKVEFAYFFGQFLGTAIVLFIVGFIAYRLIRGKYLADEKTFADKVWLAKFIAILLMLFIALSPIIRVAAGVPST